MHDNAKPHMAARTRDFLECLGWKIFSHPAYSPDLAPSDFSLFPKVKKFLAGKHFSSDAEVQKAVNEFFHKCSNEFFAMGIERLVSRYNKCLDNSGNYIEK